MKKPNGYWNYERCYEEAKKYHSRKEFRKGNQSAYNAALKNKWMDDYYWFEELHKPHNYWNYDTCYGAAMECKTRTEFYQKYSTAYELARRMKWLDDYNWFVIPEHYRKWMRETCYVEAQRYNTRSEFQKGSNGAYTAALNNGWLNDYTWMQDKRFDKINDKIDSVYVYEFREYNCAYVGRTVKWQQTDRYYAHCTKIEEDAVAKFAYENNLTVPGPIYLEQDITLAEGRRLEGYWLNKYKEMGWTMLNRAEAGSIGAIGAGKWTRKACYREAKKYNSRYEFQKANGAAYHVALRKGWLNDYTWFEEKKKPNGYWEVYENNKAKAMEYTSRSEFSKYCGAAYTAAHKNGWLDGYTWFEEKKKPNGYWNNYESCRNAAKECKGRGEFNKKYGRAYDVANDNGWLDEFFPESKKESD